MILHKLSVILPVYNGMPYLPQAIESLLGQTFQDFVVYAIDNGSTDATPDFLTQLNNEKIRFIRLEKKNLVNALNKGLESADTPLIARMDADDICDPFRFEKQINFLDTHNEIDMVGSNGQYINKSGDKHLNINVPLTHDKLVQTMLKKRNAIIHASIMFRGDIIKAYGMYDNNYYPCEDYELFLRMGHKIKFANLPDRLYQFRIHENSIITENIKLSTKLYYFISDKYSSNYKNRTGSQPIEKFSLKFWEKLDIISMSIYRKGLNHYLNRSRIIGIFYFMLAALLSPSRLIGAIKKI
jgi:glycosyltransferase involved in cell wall biosynthesis